MKLTIQKQKRRFVIRIPLCFAQIVTRIAIKKKTGKRVLRGKHGRELMRALRRSKKDFKTLELLRYTAEDGYDVILTL